MIKLLHGDCLEKMAELEAGSVDAIVTDPPYNIGKATWDKIPDYLSWCEKWIAEASRVCKRQGAFWCFHSEPEVLIDISRMIAKHGRSRQNWITWDKYNASSPNVKYIMNRTKIGRPEGNGKRTFDQDAEYIIYHADDGQWMSQSDECRGFIFEPLRAYLCGEFKRAKMLNTAGKIAANVACGFSASSGGMASRHYFSKSQWCLPTPEHYNALRELLNNQGGNYLRREYDDLRREYDDLRREYEHLRPTFNNPGKVSSVWQYPPAKSQGHITTKPVEIMQRIIESTTNEGDIVLDPFTGSGTTGVACVKTGRSFIGIELDKGYFELANKRILQAKQSRGLLNYMEATNG